jgi:hypothetical protein
MLDYSTVKLLPSLPTKALQLPEQTTLHLCMALGQPPGKFAKIASNAGQEQ